MTSVAGPVGEERSGEPSPWPGPRAELSGERRTELGKAARAAVPLASHAEWAPDAGRDPVALLEIQAAERVPELVPIRHGRMVVSPFTYFRGAALSMASDLDSTPTSGMAVQLCGDAHLANFGFFASPERHLFFDVNDFDETAPGPWEWDVKRLAASLEVAARDDDFSAKERARIVRRAVRSYRETMREFSIRPVLEVWYAHLDIDDLLPRFESLLDRERTPSVWASIVKARAHDSLQAFGKLCHVRDGEPRIVHDPPLIVPIDELTTRRRSRCHVGGARRDRPVVHGHAAVRPAAPARAVPRRRLRPQGRRRRQRRDRELDRPARRPRSRVAAVPPDQGGAELGARAVHDHERVLQSRPARRRRSAVDPGRQRHLPRMESCDLGRRRARLLLPSAPRLEGLRGHWRDDARRHGPLGSDVRLDPRHAPTPVRAIASPSPRTSASPTPSTAPSRTSAWRTRTRTSAITSRSPTPSPPDGSRPSTSPRHRRTRRRRARRSGGRPARPADDVTSRFRGGRHAPVEVLLAARHPGRRHLARDDRLRRGARRGRRVDPLSPSDRRASWSISELI